MSSYSPDEQRKRMAAFLAHQRTGVLCCIRRAASGAAQGTWAMPIWYRPRPGSPGKHPLQVDCLVPQWADIAPQLTQACPVVFIVEAPSAAGLRWLQIQGTARPLEAPDWTRLLPRRFSTVQPDALYLVVRLTASRMDLMDEDLGWGVQETLEW